MARRRRTPAATQPPPDASVDEAIAAAFMPAAPPQQPQLPAPSPIAGLPNSLAGATHDGPLARLKLVIHRVELTPEPSK
jgi:hypothetical protein